MAAKRTILISLMLGASLLLAACGGSSSHSTPPTAAISIALNPKPSTTTVMVGNTTGVQFTAVVNDDSSNAGVDWAITCPAYTATGATGFQPAGGGGPFPCGTLSIAPTMHTASGKSVTYTPPSYLPSGDTTVTIVAYATADHTQNVATPLAVNSYTNVLKGTYVLQVQGTDGINPYQATGAFVFDGKGNITSGEETFNTFASPYSASFTLQGSSGAPSTYFIGADGRGTAALNVQQVSSPTNTITQNLSFVVLSNAKALVADLGDSPTSGGPQVAASGSGTLELQDPVAATATPMGVYAFVTNGIDTGTNSYIDASVGTIPVPTAMGGVINITQGGSISSTGSLADQEYEIYNSSLGLTIYKLLSCAPASLSGTVSPPDSLGAVSLLLIGSTCFGAPPHAAGSIQLAGYIVDSNHIRLIESDDVAGTSGFLTSGIAVQQAVPTGGFNTASLSGSYVFGISGMEAPNANYGFTPYTPSSFTSAGVINADGNGNFSGETDTFFLTGGTQATVAPTGFPDNPIRGNYALDAQGIGRALLAPFIFKGITTPHPSFLLYLTGNGSPPLALWAGGADNNFPAVGAGETYVQAASPSILGFSDGERYGVSFTAVNPLATNPVSGNPQQEDDGSGLVTSPSQSSGNWTAIIDDTYYNLTSNGSGAPLSFSDPFVTSIADTFGRLNGGFIYNLSNLPAQPPSQVAYYMIDDNHAVFVEDDWVALNSASGPVQVASGYFAQGCDVTSATSCQAAAQAAKKRSSQGRKGHAERNGVTRNH